MAKDPELLAHHQWLGYVQPVGLVVSAPALLQAQAYLRRDVAAEQQRFLRHVSEKAVVGQAEGAPAVNDLRALLLDVFGWKPTDLIDAGDPRAAGLEVVLTDYHETLRPTYAVPDPDGPPRWLLLVQQLPLGTPLDDVSEKDQHRWQTSPQARFERLLRETAVPIGLVSNGTHLRLVYAPRGESVGHLTFPVREMTEVAGRPMLAALLMLLSEDRVFSLGDKQRLPAILAESRKYQNTVSNELAGQVLAALFELLRGFQAADAGAKGELLRAALERDPEQVYAGLVTVLLRLVFVLYAEDRGLMSDDEVYLKYYSVAGLFERLRADAGRWPDTMDQRYGAWAQLLALFRMVYHGARRGKLRLPPRHGYLFDPRKYAFLEGRPHGAEPQPGERIHPPLVADGVVFRVLNNLLVLDGERIPYRTLDVEQIGSVYERIMGFRLEKAAGRAIAVKPAKPHGAPATVNLEELLAVPAKDRGKRLKELTDQNLAGAALNALKAAETPEALVAALDRKTARDLTPNIVPPGSMVLQPSDERRRSGSHYTPRSLTEPIVRKALAPIVGPVSNRPGERQVGNLPHNPSPKDILNLKICDPAMGSGAFLVEACRQLGDALLAAWAVHGGMPPVPADETPELLAQRLVAQRCLYGVDKNPMAVDLAKLSLWLATLAKDHAFTFLDHSLRCGDSLVGLTRRQIADFHWKPTPARVFGQREIEDCIRSVAAIRQEILEGGDFVAPELKSQKLAKADADLTLPRFAGNLVVAAFFAGDKDRHRLTRRDGLLAQLTAYLRTSDMTQRPTAAEAALRAGDKGVTPFHWEVEFPEVFGRDDPGFDCIVGNPPFMGGTRVSSTFGDSYLDWVLGLHPESHGNADLVAHFFRRAFSLLRPGGTFGLIATNTIAQGDTRATGLRWICTRGGVIYAARRRYKWPGLAAVVVSVVHVANSMKMGPCELDGKPTSRITAYLFHSGGHENPTKLGANTRKSFLGSKIYGQGFLFDDTDKDGISSSLAEMRRLTTIEQRNAERIFPYIGGEEVNDRPTHDHHRYVINFGDVTEMEARRWPQLMKIVEEKVKPQRSLLNRNAIARKRASNWWVFGSSSKELYARIRSLARIIARSLTSRHHCFTFLPNGMIYDQTLILFALDSIPAFAALSSSLHEVWSRFFGATMKDDPRYNVADCFETFPFPDGFESDPRLEAAGRDYYEFRAALMVRNNEGLTKTYNRFHDPNERSADVARLRELHAAMDRAVLDAYGWSDLTPTCEFLLDYEEEEEERSGGMNSPARRRKKPWRCRWPDDFRDEVLARLLELNKRRAEAEALAGAVTEGKGTKGGKKGRGKQASQSKGPALL
jgi:hypothetical protein